MAKLNIPENFSLLYPSGEKQNEHLASADRPYITEEVCEEIGLCEILDLKNSSLPDFFTTDTDIINYRMETFRDLLDNPSLVSTLRKLLPILQDIMELRRLEADGGDTYDYLASITEIELYI